MHIADMFKEKVSDQGFQKVMEKPTQVVDPLFTPEQVGKGGNLLMVIFRYLCVIRNETLEGLKRKHRIFYRNLGYDDYQVNTKCGNDTKCLKVNNSNQQLTWKQFNDVLIPVEGLDMVDATITYRDTETGEIFNVTLSDIKTFIKQHGGGATR